MPDFLFTSPEGKKYTVKGPPGGTREQAFDTLQKHLSAKKPDDPPPSSIEAPEHSATFDDIVGGAIEPNLSMLTGAVAAPVSGLAGLGAMGTNALGMTHTDPADVVNSVQSGMTYSPKTQGGKDAMKVIGAPFEELAKLPPYLSEKLGLGPGASTVLDTAINAAPQLLGGEGLGKGLRKPGASISPEARMLSNKGATLTPGQARGGLVNSVEQKLTSLPIVGEIIKNARGRTVTEFSQIQVDDSLKEIGQRLPKGLKGHDAIAHAGDQFDAAYNQILPKLKGDLNSGPPTGSKMPTTPGSAPPTSLRSELDGLKQMGQQGLPPEQAATLTRIIDQEITAKFTSSGKASGQTLQEIRENLKNEIDAHTISTVPADRKVALALITAREAMDKMITRENPAYAKQYEQLRRGYAKYSIAQQAAGYKGAKEGIATPSHFTGAVRAKDRSKGKRKFAQGKALQQPLAKAGEKVLGATEPDSGTAGRYATMELLGAGGGAAALGHPGFLIGAAIIPALYSKVGLKALQPFIMGDASPAPAVARALPVGAATAAKQQYQPPNPALQSAGVAQ